MIPSGILERCVATCHARGKDVKNRPAKRLLDISISCIAGLIALPVLAIVALAILIDSGRPVLYWSRRVGRNGVPFDMAKFRTMSTDAPELPSDEITTNVFTSSFSRFLRKSSLDELPQLYNVLRGELSLVGPRPPLPRQTELIRRRAEIGVCGLTPGLTGWAQINGRDRLSEEEKVELDRVYMLEQSMLMDVRILLMTAIRVITAADVREPTAAEASCSGLNQRNTPCAVPLSPLPADRHTSHHTGSTIGESWARRQDEAHRTKSVPTTCPPLGRSTAVAARRR